MHFILCFLCYQINEGLLFFSVYAAQMQRKFFLLLGVHQTQDLGCPTGSATNEYPTTFCSSYMRMPEHSLCTYSKRLQMEWLTNVPDVKMLAEICSLINNFIKDFFWFRNNACDNFNLYSVGISS